MIIPRTLHNSHSVDERMPDVILLGDINIDISASMPAYPSRGGEGVANAVEYHTGGSVVSTAVALSKMGVETGIIGRVGNDALSSQVMSDLAQFGIDGTHIQIDSVVSTGLIYIVVNPDGERTMFAARGANVFTSPDEKWADYFASSRWYHFSGYALLAEPQSRAAGYALDLAQQIHCRVSLDPNPEPAMRYSNQILSLLPKVDIFFPNEQELMLLSGGRPLEDAIESLLDAGAKAVVVKRGVRGCVVATRKTFLELPAFEIRVKNTTGAGDCFNAGVVLGRMVGLGWAASAILGNALGAIASANAGAGAATVSANRVVELIEQDMFKPQWEKWHGALEQVLAYLTSI